MEHLEKGAEANNLTENALLGAETMNRNRSNNDLDKFSSGKTIPELIVSVVDSTPHEKDGKTLQVEAGSITAAIEPDIVQSTKSSGSFKGQTPPPRPIAPPRRKNMNHAKSEVVKLSLVGLVLITFAIYTFYLRKYLLNCICL